MPKKIIVLLAILFFANSAFANTYYELGMKYLDSYQYTSAIEQFRNSLRQYPTDYNSRIGLVNSYLARATYYNNTAKNYQKALNDLRSALFYLKYYDDGAINTSLQSAVEKTENNIKELYVLLKPNTTPEGLLASAKQLRNQSELPSSFLVYQQLIGTKYDKEASIGSGDILKVLKNPSRAIVYYNKVLKNDPNNYDLLIKIGECYQDAGDSKSAAEIFNKALTVSKSSELALDNLEKIWRKQVYQVPSSAEAHANLGVIYQQKGEYDEAIQEYLTAEKLNPNNINTKLNIGTLYQLQKKYDNAITMYDQVLFKDEKNVSARLYKAQCLHLQGKDDLSLIEYKRVLAFSPDNQEAKQQMFGLAATAENPEEIVNIVTQDLQNPAEVAQAKYQLAYEFHKNKKYEDAKKYYLASIEMNPDQPDAYLNLADVYVQLKDNQSALNVLNGAKAKYPLNIQITEYLKKIQLVDNQKILETASKALLAGEYEKALSTYKSIQPETVDSLLGVASSYQTMDKMNDAIIYYKKAYVLEPQNNEIAYYIANAYVNIEDYENAKTYLRKVLAANPKHQNANNLMNYIKEDETQAIITKALDFYNNKKYKEAYDMLTTAISKNPMNATLYYYRGLVLDAQNQYKLAINDYKNTVKYDVNFDLAYYSLGVDFDTVKDYKDAFYYYNKYLQVTKEQNEYTEFTKKRIEELKKYVPNIAQVK